MLNVFLTKDRQHLRLLLCDHTLCVRWASSTGLSWFWHDFVMHVGQYNSILLTTFLFINVRNKHDFLFCPIKCMTELFSLSATGSNYLGCPCGLTSCRLRWWCFSLKTMLLKKVMWSSYPSIYWSYEGCRHFVDEIFGILVGSGYVMLCSWTFNFLWFTRIW